MISDKYAEEDLDEEFKSEDSNEDEGDAYEVADQLGIFSNVEEDKMQAKLGEIAPKKYQ